MAKLEIRNAIDAPLERTFRAFSDVNRFAELASAITKVELLTEGPIGVGTRFTETRRMFGKEATEAMEFTEYQFPNSYTIEAKSHGSHYISRFQFETNQAGATDVRLVFEAKPLSFFAKLMTPFAKAMTNSVRKTLQSDFEDIKRHLESNRAGD